MTNIFVLFVAEKQVSSTISSTREIPTTSPKPESKTFSTTTSTTSTTTVSYTTTVPSETASTISNTTKSTLSTSTPVTKKSIPNTTSTTISTSTTATTTSTPTTFATTITVNMSEKVIKQKSQKEPRRTNVFIPLFVISAIIATIFVTLTVLYALGKLPPLWIFGRGRRPSLIQFMLENSEDDIAI